MGKFRTSGLLFVVCALTGSGCGPAYPAAYQPLVPTEEEAAWDDSLALERAGNAVEAAKGYEALCQRRPPFERGCYDRVRIAFDVDPAEKARQSAADFIGRFQDSAFAPIAVELIVESCSSATQAKPVMDMLQKLALGVEGSDVWDSVLSGVARLAAMVQDRGAEKAALQSIVRQGRWGSQRYDNAIWRLIEMERERANLSEEERLIRKMLDTRESSWLIGSYDSGLHDDALLRLGEILLIRNKKEDAYRMFHELSKWTSSPLSDEGLLRSAQVQFSIGKKQQACRHLDELLEKMPGSSTEASAKGQRVDWNCGIMALGEDK